VEVIVTDAMAQSKRRYPTVEAEIVDRVRRIETRFTKFMEAQGFDTQVAKPIWITVGQEGYILAPSPAVALREILDVIPKDFTGLMIPVKVGADLILTIHTPES
jgi:hypothetical protein